MAHCTRAAFSLLEMAVVLAILGLMLGYGLFLSDSTAAGRCLAETHQQMVDVRLALERHVADTQRYPLPAGRSVSDMHPDFGHAVATGTDARIDRVAGARPVLIGALPFATLGLSPDMGRDCWGHMFTYAVTEVLTTETGYKDPVQRGGIEIRHGTLSVHMLLADDAAYAVVSHGQDALGSTPFGYDGEKRNCNGAWGDASVRRIDKENCDTLNPVLFAADHRDGDADEELFFDDVVLYTRRPAQAPPAPEQPSCEGGMIEWGGNCKASALITLLGLSVTLTNINSGYTGVAISTCQPNGVRQTIGTCLPIGTCTSTSPRGGPLVLLTGVSMNYGPGICKRYSCCQGNIHISSLGVCPLLDLPGTAVCP